MEDEDSMLKVILFMLEMKRPTERHVLKMVLEGTFEGGRDAELFPKGTTDFWGKEFYTGTPITWKLVPSLSMSWHRSTR